LSQEARQLLLGAAGLGPQSEKCRQKIQYRGGKMPMQETSLRLSRDLSPLCSRHEHVMRYEDHALEWKEKFDTMSQTLSSYHCGYLSCTVHYAPSEGYFTVVDTPDIPHFIEEPGVNLFRCPQHGTWLYQSRAEADARKFVWRCGIENCKYSRAGNDRNGMVDHPIG
jgi:hypothetical protein